MIACAGQTWGADEAGVRLRFTTTQPPALCFITALLSAQREQGGEEAEATVALSVESGAASEWPGDTHILATLP